MITEFCFENYKSFQRAELAIVPFTTLVGMNASGKTNGIEGIKLLSEISTGRELSVILDGSKNMDSGIRGGSKGCCRFKSSTFRLGCKIKCDDGTTLQYEISVNVANRILIQEEFLKRDGDKIFYTKRPDSNSSDIKVAYNNKKPGTNPDLLCIRTSSILAQMQTKMPQDEPVFQENVRYISLALNELKDMLFLEPVPSEMRDYWRSTDFELRKNCENISAVVKELCSQRELKKELLDSIKMLPENEIENISFVNTSLGDVIFTLSERYGKTVENIDAKRLSDGTLRCIAVMSAVLTVPEKSYLIIEEVDNGIHPGRARGLIQTLSSIAARRNITIIITTHNAALLNCLSPGNLEGVAVAYREPGNGASSFIRLMDVPGFYGLMAKGKLGDLMTDNSLLKAIKSSGAESPADYTWMEGLL